MTKKKWKQAGIEFKDIGDGRVGGRFKDSELAREMGSAGGVKGGVARVDSTTDEFRRLNSVKASLYRWGRSKEWTVDMEKKLEEQRHLIDREDK